MSIEKNEIAILSVAYHSHKALRELSQDLSRQTCQPKQWLVVNNSPSSARPLMLTTKCPVSVISGEEGDGFARGCNRGLDELHRLGWKGWVWLLNPDTALPEIDIFEKLVKELGALSDQALVGTVVNDINGNLEKSAGWIDPGLDFRRRKVTKSIFQKFNKNPVLVDWISGCSMIFKPTAHEIEPRFDASMPLYYEDVDLCLRLGHLGVQIFWLPSIAISHSRGFGSETPYTRRLRLSSCSYIRFLQRHRPGLVLLLRTIRLIINALVKLPLFPSRSFAVLQGCFDAFCNPIA